MESYAIYFFCAGILTVIGAILAFIGFMMALKDTFKAHVNYYAFKYEQSLKDD